MKKRILLTLPLLVFVILVASLTFVSAEPIKEISYLPRDYDWGRFWIEYSDGVRNQMAQDLDLIQNLGANTVRIFIQPHIVGYPQPTPQFLVDFEDALALIAAHGLKAHVTLFDFDDFYPHPPGEEIPIDDVIRDSRMWLDAIVLPHQTDNRIAVWELKNEIVLYYMDDFGIPTTNPILRAHQWLQALFPYLKQQAGSIPCTVSVSWVEWLNDIKALPVPPDIYNLHWYPNWITWTSPLPGILDRAYTVIGPGQRLMLGEFGTNTYDFSDLSQTDAFRDMLYYTTQKGTSDIGVWTLNDFPSGRRNGAGDLLPLSELYNGVYKIGAGNILSPKPVMSIIQQAFLGSPPQNPSPSILLNSSFETLNSYSNQLENWQPWNQGDPPYTSYYEQDCTQAHNGSCSVRVRPPATPPDKDPYIAGLAVTPTLKVVSGLSYTLTGYVKTSQSGLARLSLIWLNQDGIGFGETLSDAFVNATSWIPIQVEGVIPAGAAHVIVALKMIDMDRGSNPVWFDDITFVDNHSPLLNPIGDKSVYTGNYLRFDVIATDGDSDHLTLSGTGSAFDAGAYLVLLGTGDNGYINGYFLWTPSQTGTYSATFRVTDSSGAPDSEVITITVTNPPEGDGSSGGSCFLAGTKILMANGQTLPIEKVKVGDFVMAFDEKTKTLKKDRVKEFFEHKSDKYLIINERLKLTENHPVYSQGKWIEIGKLQIGDSLLNSKGESETITSIREVKEKVKVYNLEVNPYHTYIAEGVVVHNKAIRPKFR